MAARVKCIGTFFGIVAKCSPSILGSTLWRCREILRLGPNFWEVLIPAGLMYLVMLAASDHPVNILLPPLELVDPVVIILAGEETPVGEPDEAELVACPALGRWSEPSVRSAFACWSAVRWSSSADVPRVAESGSSATRLSRCSGTVMHARGGAAVGPVSVTRRLRDSRDRRALGLAVQYLSRPCAS